MFRIQTKSFPVESAYSMTIVERYHAPIRRAFNIFCKEAPDIEQSDDLQMAVKAIDDSAGLDGLVPALSVFDALSWLGLSSDRPASSKFQRVLALWKAKSAMSEHFATRQGRDALRTRNGPNITEIHQAPTGYLVLVYRPEKDKREDPFSILEKVHRNVEV